ncbi:hypothetical protein N656DRAFT_801410 [Canariomyces notabilis]|uniref:Protein kinase domain-containing protein n=1 Tax=Canariomyces notabilis TaxID=2074819 RepID=A0AAN6T8S1_9PEZI|nr:hypothetical protein N656DRAFT_801410 [Canariomyces arenarius]
MDNSVLANLGKFTFGGNAVCEKEFLVQLFDPDARGEIRVTPPNPHGFEPPKDNPEFRLHTCDRLLSSPRIPTPSGRLHPGVDLVSYRPSRFPSPGGKDENRYVFKYKSKNPQELWNEIQMLARFPKHPHIAWLDRLVLDEMTGSQVVGFTMRYAANGSLDKSKPLFKLRWLKQLMQVIDDLNLQHGIIHQDVHARNLVTDPATDSYSQYMLQDLNENHFKDPAKWIKRPDVDLNDDVAEFYFELMAWVRSRRAAKPMAHYTEAPEHISWPSPPDPRPSSGVVGSHRAQEPPFLSWRRPPASKVDPARRLLATGRYADQEDAAQAAWKAAATAAAAAAVPAAAVAGPQEETDQSGGASQPANNASRKASPAAGRGLASENSSIGRGLRSPRSPRQGKVAKRKQQEDNGDAISSANVPAKKRTATRLEAALVAN